MTSGNGNGAVKAVEAARAPAAVFPKRFYTSAGVEQAPGGFALRLDGRGARTPGRRPFVVPSRALADALALEWSNVGETIDPRTMPLTRLVNSTIDGVSQRQVEVLAEVVRFAGSDLLSYRAGEPADLVAAQREAWDPIIDWAADAFGSRFAVTEGITHIPQRADVLRHFEEGVGALVGDDAASPYRVAALHVMTTLTGSSLLAAAVAGGRLKPGEAWSAAHVEEDHQIRLWGADDEAAQRRDARWQDMKAAAALYRLVGNEAGAQVVDRSTK